jgi:hypothetical protein
LRTKDNLHISNFPIGYIELALKIRSKRLFHDAFVHSVGQWDKLQGEDMDVPDAILASILSEYKRLTVHARRELMGRKVTEETRQLY